MIIKEWANWKKRKKVHFDGEQINIFRSIMNHLTNYRYYKNRKYGETDPYQTTEDEIANLERAQSAYRKKKNLEKRRAN
jgi:hypothetical protein